MTKTNLPRDAAAVVLLENELQRENTKLYWARRSAALSFLPGYHAFPGGKLEKSDAEVAVANCDDAEQAALIACAAREAFEETGVLIARGGEALTKGQRASIHDDLISGRMTFAEIVRHWNLHVDADDFTPLGAWTTPAFSPVRFKTRFFLAVCPPKQTPFPAVAELEDVELIAAKDAFARWRRGEILCAPPILNTIRTFADEELTFSQKSDLLVKIADAEGEHTRSIELNPIITCFPQRVLTLPPATHTNCFIVGGGDFVVIDPASPFEDEQAALAGYITDRVLSGDIMQEIVITHEHSDHIGGVNALLESLRHLQRKFEFQITVAAHRRTAEALTGKIKVHRFIEDDEYFPLTDRSDDSYHYFRALHTPGHARGHLAFYDEKHGFLLTGDNVVGVGSVLIQLPEGDMRDYLDSLERMRDLPGLRFLCGAHGSAIADAKGKINSFIEHRLTRENQILEAVRNNARTAREIVAAVYTEIAPELYDYAEKSVAAHLEKLRAEKLI